jgi:hypothetical protein
MKKDIKDYLHLYLGCETDQGVLIGMVNCDNDKEDIQCVCLMKEGGLVNGAIKNIKPLLRPLDDMTEEEGYEVLRRQHSYDVMPTQGQYEVADRYLAYRLDYVHRNSKVFYQRRPVVPKTPEATRYLLSKGFDLFQLIESGLAIDKTKKH